MIRVNHRCSCRIRQEQLQQQQQQRRAEMARFSVGREEEDDNNEDGGSEMGPTRVVVGGGPVPKRRRTFSGTFSCSTVRRQQEQEQQEREREQEMVVEEEEEEEEEEEGEEEEELESESEEEEGREIGIGIGIGCRRVVDVEVSRGNGSISGVSTENPDNDLEGSRWKGSISVTLSDPDVLDCPICLEHLSVTVFQCENGHIACASCCIKIVNKCPSCCWPIGYNRCRAIEKVLESVKVSCMNKRYGCKEILSYSEKADHENACICVPCSCPFRGCDFVGAAENVYAHFSDKHAASADHIFFNEVRPIYIEKHQRYQILQMRTEGVLFIINHASDRMGSAVNIVCVEPATQKRRFLYEIVATDGESTFKLESVAESVPNWSENIPLKKFLLIPRDVANSSSRLKLDLFIKKGEYIGSDSTT